MLIKAIKVSSLKIIRYCRRMKSTITDKYDAMMGMEEKTLKVNSRVVKCVRRTTLSVLR